MLQSKHSVVHPPPLLFAQVWNEMHMDRRKHRGKLSGKTKGWQAVDATPQELSRGGVGVPDAAQFQMGPASLAVARRNQDPRGSAAKHFEGWDGEFLISEVSGIEAFLKQCPNCHCSLEEHEGVCVSRAAHHDSALPHGIVCGRR